MKTSGCEMVGLDMSVVLRLSESSHVLHGLRIHLELFFCIAKRSKTVDL